MCRTANGRASARSSDLSRGHWWSALKIALFELTFFFNLRCNRCPAANSNLKKTGKPTIKWGGHRWRIDNGEPANQTETNRTELKSNRTKPKGNDQSTKLTNKEHGLRLKTIESKKKRKECAENDQLIESKKKRKERSEDGNQLIGLDGNDAEFVKSNESEQLNASGEVTIDDKLDEGEEAECTAG